MDFNGNLDVSGTGTFGGQIVGINTLMSTTTPAYSWRETDAATDNQYWQFRAANEQLVLGTLNNALDTFVPFITTDRTGTTVDEIQLDATTLDFNGTADISGTLAWGGGSAI